MKRYLLILFLISGCITIGQSQKSSSNLPSWYINPFSNDSVNLYGVGEGFTIQEASKSALNNLAAKLAVTISSDSSTLMEENNYSANEEFRGKISERVQEVTFNNYDINNSHKEGMTFYAQVKVDRNNFIKEQKSILAQKHKIMQNLYNSSKNKNILIRRNKLSKIVDISASASIINQILNGLKVNPNYQKNLDKYQFYKDSYDNILDKIEFFIKSDNIKIKDAVIEGLNENNLKVVSLKKNNSKNLVIIDIKTTSSVKKIYGSNITNLKLKFKLISNKNKILASNITEVSGASVGNHNSFGIAVKNFSKKIKKEGILQIIGADKK